MAQKWNLQDIRPPEQRRRRAPAPRDLERRERPQEAEEPSELPEVVITDGRKSSRWQLITAALIFVGIVGGAFMLSGLLGNTEISIEPRNREPNINAEFTAYPEARENALTYEVMTLSEVGEETVTATGKETVETQASGIVEIFKTTPGTQRLIKNTRFRTDDGRVYRIEESVVVPGAVSGPDGERVPGSIRAEVFAEEAGEDYNLDANSRFDIPGFAEGGFDDLYNAMYATNPQPIDGGFVGPRFIIPDEELTEARQRLQVALRDTLLPQIEQEKPAGFVTFPGAVSFTFSRLPSEEYGDEQVIIKEEAVMHVPLFRGTDLAEFLASEAIASYEGNPVRIENVDALTFTYSDSDTAASVLANAPSLTFTLIGRPHIIWEYDADALREDLAGKPKTAINQILTAYRGIDSATASVQPFWRRSFPNDPDAIGISEVIGSDASDETGE